MSVVTRRGGMGVHPSWGESRSMVNTSVLYLVHGAAGHGHHCIDGIIRVLVVLMTVLVYEV